MFGIGATIGKIFGSDKAITSVIDNVSKGLDALVYTDEEKAEDAAKDRSNARGMVIEWMKSTQGQNLARRLIALSIVTIWLLQYLSSMIMSIIGIWIDEPDKVIKSAKIIGESAERMNGAVMLILGFYFAAPYMGSIVSGAMSKFGGKSKDKV